MTGETRQSSELGQNDIARALPLSTMSPATQHRVQTICLVVLAVLAATYLVYWLRPVLVPFVVALFIVSALSPILAVLERTLGVSRIVAAAITFLAGFALLVFFGVAIVYSVADLGKNSKLYMNRVDDIIREIDERFPLDVQLKKGPGGLIKPEQSDDETKKSANADKEPADPEEAKQTEEPTEQDPAQENDSIKRGDEPESTSQDATTGGDDQATKADDAVTEDEVDSEKSDATPLTVAISQAATAQPAEAAAEPQEATAQPQAATVKPTDPSAQGQEPADGTRKAPDLLEQIARQGIAMVSQSLLNLISTSVVVLIFVFFLLLGTPSMLSSSPTLIEINHQVRSYLALKTIISLFTGLAFGLALRIFGVPMAFTFGVLAFLLNFVPNVGPIVASLLPIPLIIFDPSGNLGWMIAVIAVTSGIQLISGNIVEPKIMGESSDLHPVVVLLSLMFWGMMWGVIGMFLATPIAAGFKIVLERFDETKPLAAFMAGRTMDDAVEPSAVTADG